MSHRSPKVLANATGDPLGEANLIQNAQRIAAQRPESFQIARGLSFFGEHALGWLVIAGLGFLVDSKHRRKWFAMGTATFLAHAESVILKRIVRRPRPHSPGVTVAVGTPSQLSFPSSHAASTTAALVSLAKITHSPLPLLGIPLMGISRIILGVHYPSDVIIGTILGGLTAEAVFGVEKRTEPAPAENAQK